MTDPVVWLVLCNAAGNRRRELSALLERGVSPLSLLRMPQPELSARSSPELAQRLSSRIDLVSARSQLESARRVGVRVLTADHPGFPGDLAAIPEPPLVLFVRGQLPPAKALAIVGS